MRPDAKAPIPIRDEVGVVVSNAQVVDDFPLARVKNVLDRNPLAVLSSPAVTGEPASLVRRH